jgi:hypothetical protein
MAIIVLCILLINSIITGAIISILSGRYFGWFTVIYTNFSYSASFAYEWALLFQGKIGVEFRFPATPPKPLNGFRWFLRRSIEHNL